MSTPARLLALAVLALSCPACLVFRDAGGVPVDPSRLATIEVGVSTRAQVLELLGAPSGLHVTDLVAALTRGDDRIRLPDVNVPDVAVWQQVDLEAELLMVPLFVLWSEARVLTRTAMVLFDAQGVVTAVAYREDGR